MEKIKKIISGLSVEINKTSNMDDMVTVFLAGIDYAKQQNAQLLRMLKEVKAIMDSTVYPVNLDNLYDDISMVINMEIKKTE